MNLETVILWFLGRGSFAMWRNSATIEHLPHDALSGLINLSGSNPHMHYPGPITTQRQSPHVSIPWYGKEPTNVKVLVVKIGISSILDNWTPRSFENEASKTDSSLFCIKAFIVSYGWMERGFIPWDVGTYKLRASLHVGHLPTRF